MRRFFAGFFLVMLTVCGVIFAITFVERLPSNPTAIAALMDSWVRLLEYIPMFLPLAVFMGTLVAYYNLTRSSEAIIISSAGRSPYQSATPFLIGAFVIGIIAATIINPYSVNLSKKNISDYHLKMIDNSIWLRESSDAGFLTTHAQNMTMKNGNIVFNKVNLYIQDTNFKLVERVSSKEAVLSKNDIEVKNATVTDSEGLSKKEKNKHIATSLNPQTVLDRYLQPKQISFWELPSFIIKMNKIGAPIRGHLIQFWTLLFLPLTMIAMAVLGIAFSQTRQRRNYSFGVKFSIGILTCFVIYFIVNFFNALGATGALPPLLSIVAPQLIIIAGAGTFITSFDTI
ncbi:MAG: LptF/LptG family permease [Alphaproteobacteria bacterium]|nr:LptF/LptG family permease [Alphaproteobacteria bacterium]